VAQTLVPRGVAVTLGHETLRLRCASLRMTTFNFSSATDMAAASLSGRGVSYGCNRVLGHRHWSWIQRM